MTPVSTGQFAPGQVVSGRSESPWWPRRNSLISLTVLADSSNFGKLAHFIVTGFDSVDCMIRDEAPDGRPAAPMARERVEIIC